MTYSCHNRPRPTSATTYPAQDGWEPAQFGTSRMPRVVHIKHVMSTDCRYDKSDTDPRCAGCQHAPVDATSIPQEPPHATV